MALQIREIEAHAPLRWLAAGWRDLWRCPLPGLVHGAVMAAFGILLAWFWRGHFWLLAGTFSGFLLMAPLMACGLYAISRNLERGQAASLATALQAWHPGDGRRVLFGVLLSLAGTGWVMTSAALITRFASAPVRSPADFIQIVMLAPEGWLFEIWLLLGGVLAAPVFASTVLALPVLMDRPASLLEAVLAGWRAVIEHPVAMGLWAALLMGLTLAAMLPLLLGLVVVLPWLAHASWHAYRDLVAPE